MKLALICPSNMLYMPYMENYISVLKENNIGYDIINWDRFQIEENNNSLIYRDSKIGHQRNFFDYYKYKRFIEEKISIKNYDKIIIFGLQLAFFLQKTLTRKFKNKYIIDIRDYNKIIKFIRMNKVVCNSNFIVLSSPGYKEWLPRSDKYILNHNTHIKNTNFINKYNFKIQKHKLNIAYIGAVRDYKINIELVNSLKNSKNFNVFFHGEGTINKEISNYLTRNNILNVYLSGRYERNEESELYNQNDLINVLRYNDGINNKTALPNRLYDSVIYGKPLLGFKGTHLAELIKKYNLGLVVSSFENIETNILTYLQNFDESSYNENRRKFIKEIIEENNFFDEKLLHFIHNE